MCTCIMTKTLKLPLYTIIHNKQLELIKFSMAFHYFLIADAMVFSNTFSHDCLAEWIASDSLDHSFPRRLSVVYIIL